MSQTLEPHRLNKVHESIKLIYIQSPDMERMISYYTPWTNSALVKRRSLDRIISQAVLQHQIMLKRLKKSGMMSHDIDFKSVGSSNRWDGHWTYTDFEWKIVKGRKTFYINREPISTHLKLLQQNGFEVVNAS